MKSIRGAQPFAAKWNPDYLRSASHNVLPVPRMSALGSSKEDIFKAIVKHENDGIPLIISDFHKTDHWNPEILDPKWILENFGNEGTDRTAPLYQHY